MLDPFEDPAIPLQSRLCSETQNFWCENFQQIRFCTKYVDYIKILPI